MCAFKYIRKSNTILYVLLQLGYCTNFRTRFGAWCVIQRWLMQGRVLVQSLLCEACKLVISVTVLNGQLPGSYPTRCPGWKPAAVLHCCSKNIGWEQGRRMRAWLGRSVARAVAASDDVTHRASCSLQVSCYAHEPCQDRTRIEILLIRSSPNRVDTDIEWSVCFLANKPT